MERQARTFADELLHLGLRRLALLLRELERLVVVVVAAAAVKVRPRLNRNKQEHAVRKASGQQSGKAN
jgi:hypothetical protein